VGEYQLSPTFSLVVALNGDQLSAQGTGQPALPLFPEAEGKFYLRAVDAQIDFVADATGAVTHLVLHQGGRDTEGKRLPPVKAVSP
jgi:hypothetical protein